MSAQRAFPRVLITDETLRDGLQIEREGITVDEKLHLLQLLVDAGLKRLMVGAFVNPKWSPQMADTAELVGRLRPQEGVQFFALALNERGRVMRREMSPPLSIEPLPATHLHLCPQFLLRNTNTTMEQQEANWRLPIERASAAGVTHAAIGLSAPWGSNWSGAFTLTQRMDALRRQYDAWTAAGIAVRRIDMADPMAWNTPQAVAEDLRAISDAFPSITDYHLHLHNARGMALVSAYQALQVLDERHTLILDTAVGGIGGCPYCGNGQATGMIATEDLVQLLQTEGVDTGIDLNRLIEASHALESLIGRPLASQVARCGPLPNAQTLYD
ncbi:MAG: citramalate synthase, partial [Rubrivivax sp.]